MEKAQLTLQSEYTIRMFVSICKTLDDESVRYIGLFKKEQKQTYNTLLESIKSFSYSIKANMDEANIKECERIQDYLHDLVADMIKENVKDIYLFCAMCKILRVIYFKYIEPYFRSPDKHRFISLILSAENFYKHSEHDTNIDAYFEEFCCTLIEGKEFKREINN